MSGFGEHRYHGTYDDVAAELGAAARRLAAPLAVAVRQRAVKAEREAARHQAAIRDAERAATRVAQTARTTTEQDHQRWAQTKRMAPDVGRER